MDEYHKENAEQKKPEREVDIVCFYLGDIEEQAKLTCSDRSQNTGYFQVLTGSGHKEAYWHVGDGVGTQVCKYVKIRSYIHLRSVHFNIHLYLKKK